MLPQDGGRLRQQGWTRCVVLLASVSVLFFALGRMASGVQKADKVVRADTIVAEKFQLVGPKGAPVATLQLGKDGKPTLSFLDEKGAERLTIGIHPTGPGLSILDGRGQLRLQVYLDEQIDGAVVQLSDGTLKGETGARLSADKSLSSLMLAKGGVGRIFAQVSEGAPSVQIVDAKGNLRAMLTNDEDLGPSFSMTDNDGRTRAGFTLSADGLPELRLTDQTGKSWLKMAVDREGKVKAQKFERPDNP